jgi:hypothetical protein
MPFVTQHCPHTRHEVEGVTAVISEPPDAVCAARCGDVADTVRGIPCLLAGIRERKPSVNVGLNVIVSLTEPRMTGRNTNVTTPVSEVVVSHRETIQIRLCVDPLHFIRLV